MITFDTHPDHYRHWRLGFDADIATLTLDVAEDQGLVPGYRLKLNSYDLGVDIELYDALNRIRFEHPEVKAVVITSGKPRLFCSGANIYMLGQSSHAFKVNFCKFTNETRNGIEDASQYSGLRFLAALNGATAGGGYELALACDEILMIDDRSSTVSLPEVPLLGVLPGTGGLTRLIDKRRVRRDLADLFCTSAEGVRAERARDWGLVDHIARPQQFAEAVRARAATLAASSDRPGGAGVTLTPLERTEGTDGWRYPYLEVKIDRSLRYADVTIAGPAGSQPQTPEQMLAAGAAWWPLAVCRALDDAILHLRTNEADIGLWLLRTNGASDAMLALDAQIERHAQHWFVRETLGWLRRTLARLDVSSRSLFALIEPGSCFAGTLAELVLAADRSFMLASPDGDASAPRLALSNLNFGAYPMVNGAARLANRFGADPAMVARLRALAGQALDARAAAAAGLVTLTPDALDWDHEVRIALEERVSLSPDALTGLEANLRFGLPETMATRVFGRLSAWQNWVFSRPNAVGEAGALKVYGSGAKAKFSWERI